MGHEEVPRRALANTVHGRQGQFHERRVTETTLVVAQLTHDASISNLSDKYAFETP
jgi:hypothetical protein